MVMLDTIHTVEASTHATGIAAASCAANATTKAELLERAKAAVERGEQSLHDAAEALGLAEEDHSATQREMAEAVGKSASWVNKLLKWRRSGYKDHSPFGPTTKRGRVEHAQQGAMASEPGKMREPKITASADDDDAAASGERRKAKYANEEDEAPSSAHTSPLDGFKAAVDHWFPMMDCRAKREAIDYAVVQSKIQGIETHSRDAV